MICEFCKKHKAVNEFGAKPNPKYAKRGWWCKQCEANRTMVRKHGVTNDQKQKIAAYQCGCAICGHADPGGKGWTVDHDRSCCSGPNSCHKCRRGVICTYCNAMLGFAFDRRKTLQAAIEYLETHGSGICAWHRPVACSGGLCGKSVSA